MNLILVGYTPSKTRAALAFCATAFRNLRFSHRVLVCNRPGLIEPSALNGWTVLSGSNAFAEFSGWQEGLDHLLAVGSREAVVFVNDTVNTHRRFSLFRRWALVREFKRAPARSLIGFVDNADDHLGELSIDGLPLQGWASTYCFLLGQGSLERLQHRLYSTDTVDKCVLGGVSNSDFFSDRLSPDLRRHLNTWLFGGGWYGSEPLTEANAALFTSKARTICAELYLSAHCWNLGILRRDPFERNPWSRFADRTLERLWRRFEPAHGRQ